MRGSFHRSLPRGLAVAGALALLIALRPWVGFAGPPVYDIRELASPSGEGTSSAYAINNGGHVVGCYTERGGRYAVRWANSDVQDVLSSESHLPQTLWGSDSIALAINDLGEVVGSATSASGVTHAFLRTQTCETLDLGVLSPGMARTAFGVNTLRTSVPLMPQVVGSSDTSGGETHAFLWPRGRRDPARGSASLGAGPFSLDFVDLGTLGGRESIAYAINDAGEVVGSALTTAGVKHAVRWTAGAPRDLGTLGGADSVAYAINAAGHVVGSARTANGQTHAFLWTSRGMQDLGTLGGGSESEAYGINKTGEVVGMAVTASGARHAFLYSPGATALVDLNSRIDIPYGEKWELLEARGINDAGWIVGTALHNGVQRAFVLHPKGSREWLPGGGVDELCKATSVSPGTPSVDTTYTRIAVYHPPTSQWTVYNNNDETTSSLQFGGPGDQPVPADYLGTGYAQLAVFRPSSGQWFIRKEDGSGTLAVSFAAPFTPDPENDIPVPGDYLQTGRTQIAIYRQSTRQWFLREGIGSSGTDATTFGPITVGPAPPPGAKPDVPVPANYLPLWTQMAVFRPDTQEWFIRKAFPWADTSSSSAQELKVSFGGPGDVPLPLRWVDGQQYVAVLRPTKSPMEWYIRKGRPDSPGETIGPIAFGQPGDIAVPGNYTSRTSGQLAVYHPSMGEWTILRDNASPDAASRTMASLLNFRLGGSDDIPVPARYPFYFGLK